jgi:Mg/Co/Ni transporter MgtE
MNKQEWLLSQIEKFPTLSARELVSELNKKVLVDNPEPQNTVPLIPSLEEVLKLVTGEEAFVISETETFKRILSAINEQKVKDIISNLSVLKRGNVLSETSFNKIIPLLEKTQPDPNYQSRVYMSEVELAGFDVVFVHEVEAISPLI